MENSNRILQFLGIPFTALQSVILGLLLVSFPIGIYIVFESEIGGDINYEYPLTHLALFENTELYQVPFDVNIGDAFVVLWIFYSVLFTIAIFGPKHGFLKSLSPIISFGKFNTTSNYMIGTTKWFSILILISALINFIQEAFGIVTVPPLDDNDLIQFFYVSLAPLIEEFGFRLILIGIPLFALYSHKSSPKYFIKCLWTPSSLHIDNYKKAFLLIAFVGVFFGFAHIAFAESWSEGKFAQAAASGVVLGWVYLRYGFVSSLLIHWAMNYFVFSYANFISQLNYIPIQEAFSHSLMSSLEILLLISGAISVSILFVNRFYSKKESTLEV
ncbi:CPBP family glutamic-type intramembrane protease [Nitrosopumilus ureiphilus]|uniref:CPBP family intramembrane metalloprotease domain-containing protein n=1 Tax=Nitrosopumilus ureiphilus TaxID=1470067 RepID=A0A7D5R5V6_9ARCH|nr:CPBP family glutamic-type intramembrane protease [Nitrosopumilus ureiphilus]QLH06437.1 CPBP family intramembrane metalloprotease domain-containing protein [Nitrosopumilus ureiphilus]